MMIEHITQAGDVLDKLCYQYQGSTDHIADVLAQNPHLADYGPILPKGVVIEFEEITETPVIQKSVQLWD